MMATKWLEHLCYEERLRELGLVHSGKEKAPKTPQSGLHNRHIERPSYNGGPQENWGGSLSECSDSTRGKGFKLKEGRSRLK